MKKLTVALAVMVCLFWAGQAFGEGDGLVLGEAASRLGTFWGTVVGLGVSMEILKGFFSGGNE